MISEPPKTEIEWFAPDNDFRPIHLRIDMDSLWYDDAVAESAFVYEGAVGYADKDKRTAGKVAELAAIAALNEVKFLDEPMYDFSRRGKLYDVVGSSIGVPPKQSYDISLLMEKYNRLRERFPSGGLYYYGIRYNLPDVYLIGEIDAYRFWLFADVIMPGDTLESGYSVDAPSGELGLEHFEQFAIGPGDIHPPPAIDVVEVL